MVIKKSLPLFVALSLSPSSPRFLLAQGRMPLELLRARLSFVSLIAFLPHPHSPILHMALTFATGDATAPQEKPAVIVHVCNDVGAWGKGFTKALSKRWPQPEAAFRGLKSNGLLTLGSLQIVQVEEDIWVANIVAQAGIGRGHRRIQNDVLARVLAALARELVVKEKWSSPPSVHMPLIGTGLGGGQWDIIEPIIATQLADIAACRVYSFWRDTVTPACTVYSV